MNHEIHKKHERVKSGTTRKKYLLVLHIACKAFPASAYHEFPLMQHFPLPALKPLCL